MSKTVDAPIIALFEDRPKQGMVFQLNLSVYLDARVVSVSSIKELKEAMNGPEGIHLAIVRAQFKGKDITGQVAELLLPKKIPLISIGGKERDGVIVVEDNAAKPMLQASAKLFGITAQQMVAKVRPDTFDIAPEYLNMLFSTPCKIFCRKGEGKELLFNTGDIMKREKIKLFIDKKESLVIDTFHRLRLANSVTEQNLNAAKDLVSDSVSDEKKMSILAASVDMVAAQFKSAGMDAETVDLANSSIKAIEKIAESATSVGNLVKDLMKASGGYRYAHSQLLTFLGFHVIKMMGWWGDDQRNIISQAAFYHDISLGTDEEAKVRSNELLKTSGITDSQKLEVILTHAQLSARELQTVPDISPEVVRVVIQHHGSPVGRGFSTDIAKLENLSKAFVLSEEWADYLIGLSESDQTPDNAAKIAELKNIYKEDQCQQIIETFRYLDVEQFTNDFLAAPDYSLGDTAVDTGFAEALVSGSASVEESAAAALKGEASSKLEEVVVKGGKDKGNEQETRLKSAKNAKEKSKKISGGTEVRSDEEILVKGGEEEANEEESRFKGDKAATPKAKKVSGVTDVREDEEILVKGGKEDANEEERRFKGDKAATPKAKKITGVTDVREDEEILVKGGKEDANEEERRFKGDKAATPKAKKITGVTDVRTDEEILVKGNNEEASKKETRVKGETMAEKIAKKVSSVTHVRKDEEILVSGEKPAEDSSQNILGASGEVDASETRIAGEKAAPVVSQKIEGVTDVRKDEEILIKGDKTAKDLIDRSIVRIKADTPEAQRELKMKALAGSSDFMKAALSGALEVVTSMIAAASNVGVELRKTDADGRTAIHYAAMGGSIPVIKLLIEKGAQLNAVDSKRRSPLFFTALHKHNEAFDFILEKGGKINQQAMGGMTIAMVGAFSGNLHILKAAVEKGVRVDTKDHSGKTAMDYAKQSKNAEAIAYLESLAVKKPADPAKASAA